MSAVMQPARTRIDLPITQEMPRKLVIGWEVYPGGIDIHAHAFIRADHEMRSVAFGAAHKVNEARLTYAYGVPTLWLRSTQFELTAAEAAEVERVFGPLGLRIERDGL